MSDTVDAAREAHWSQWLHDEVGLSWDDVNATVAMAEAEWDKREAAIRADAEAKLAALREAAATVYEHHTMQANHWDTDQHRCWIVLRDALAATPAEDACSVCGVPFREHPDTDACAIAEQSR